MNSVNGYLVTFYTQQDRRHGHQQISEWLMDLARDLGFEGATLNVATEGFGRDRKLHSAHFIELSDMPVQLSLAITEQECNTLFERLEADGVQVFFIKVPIEMGTSGRHS
ncbi:DUF190 domain-containing protein [Pseudomonas sp. KNUC1026]|uniref:DUF190 domain-containing protein n=1 Tax=Pseudomonas sp. KNUC1026 TaxID=2893890 RepID=UPI001F2E085F|nr:DUF190 domain-containing protein [Pseudomonas sp. KNUC1026]UFH48986.1 DUF190 domain-containing protein [Pseudomonas sp. KNUC1026]